MVDLSVNIGPLHLDNPVMTASGTFGYAQEFADFVDLEEIGGIVTKTITPEPRPGNPPLRIVEFKHGMLNSIGLPNAGVEAFILGKMPFLRKLKSRIIVNIAGKIQDDFVIAVERLNEVEGIDAYECNFSCPNVKQGGLSFSADANVAHRVTGKVRRATSRPLIAKLTPNVTSIGDIGQAVQDAGADAVSAVNTFVGMAVNIRTKRPKLATVTGGYSGPAIKPLALAKVHELVNRLSIPVIAIGGISTAEDALEFLITGASAIQVGTANFSDPESTLFIKKGILDYCQEQGIEHLHQLIGCLKV